MRSDFEVCKIAVQNTGMAFQFIDGELCSNEELIMLAYH